MNARWIGILIIALCLVQQPGKPDTEPIQATTIFEKLLSPKKRLIVTCKVAPIILTSKESAEQKEMTLTTPGVAFFDHLCTYSYVTVTKGGPRSVLWTQYQPTLGAVTPGKTSDMSMSIEVYDVALLGNVLLVLYQEGSRTEVNIVRLHASRGAPSSLRGSGKPQAAASRDAVQSPLGQYRLVETAGSSDAVSGGRILEPDPNGDIAVELHHAVKQKDGSARITIYHLVHTIQDQEFWRADASNIYAPGEQPGNQL